MKRRFPTGLKVFLIIASVVVSIWAFWLISIGRALSWDVHENLTAEQKIDYSKRAMMPELADCVERYGVRGLMDAEYMIETYRYDSVDAMCDALPEGSREGIEGTLANATPTDSKDIKGKRVKLYHIEYGLPLLPEDQVEEKYYVYTYNAFQHYYIYEYGDGTYRFAADVATC